MKKIGLWICTVMLICSMVLSEWTAPQVLALSAEEQEWVDEARLWLQNIVAEREIMALIYLTDEYQVRVAPTHESESVIAVSSGQSVYIEDIAIDENYQAWSYVRFELDGVEYTGYVERNNIACSDQRFLEWEMQYGMNPGAFAMYAVGEGVSPQKEAEIAAFPESYRDALRALSEAHPTWTFVRQDIDLKWADVIANELTGGRSLIEKLSYLPDCSREGLYGGRWYYASEDILEWYMDPRNNLTEDKIFQFEYLTYNEIPNGELALQSFLKNTFMTDVGVNADGTYYIKNAPGTSMPFYHFIYMIGKEEGREVSPFHLASRILQEQGQGTSPLISGYYKAPSGTEYVGLYNYFNVGASGTTPAQEIENGLIYARDYAEEENGVMVKKPWNNAYVSIMYGSNIISRNYIKKYQDTIYLQKFNVDKRSPYGVYNHQYMQNIAAPSSEGKKTRDMYANAGVLETGFVFKIPVFKDMPGQACAMPVSTNNIALKVPAGYDGSKIYLDGTEYKPVTRNGHHIVTAKDANAKTAVVFKYNEDGGYPTGMYLWTLEYQNGAYVVTEQPELKDLLTYHGFSIRIRGKSGIRCKTGVDANLKQKLLTTGVNGYVLKEYGTLIMNDANRGTYPMIKGGEKVAVAMAYGKEENGILRDKVYETIDNRNRFTAVLVGLPTERYKTEFAFGGYAILEKDGKQINVYGPAVSRSIYGLAQRLLSAGSYKEGSEEYNFLRKLISDADALSTQ